MCSVSGIPAQQVPFIAVYKYSNTAELISISNRLLGYISYQLKVIVLLPLLVE